METWQGLFLAIGWFVLRFGVPLVGTILMIYFFKWLDRRWQIESMDRRASMGAEAMLPIIQCWAMDTCPAEKCQSCVAFQNQGTPCWQHFRAGDGSLKDECLGCKVFLGVSAPALHH
ncbi:MAG TPA: hypothetical protein DEH25_05995 [Chloroflexi bacterium]|nr:hypothetical protein [Chloroflexota bacterium]HBY08554.1 hypothetical protein [Chloroflexota bacterium]